jgi:hypothetical protein
MTTANNHLVSFLIMTSAVTQSELTPWSAWSFTGTVTTTVTTTVWVITCVHNDTTYSWADAFAAFATSRTDFNVLVLDVANYTNVCTTTN